MPRDNLFKPYRLKDYTKSELLVYVVDALSGGEFYKSLNDYFSHELDDILCKHFSWVYHGSIIWPFVAIKMVFDKFMGPQERIIHIYPYEGHSMFENNHYYEHGTIRALHEFYLESNYQNNHHEKTIFMNGDNNLQQRYDEWFSKNNYPYKFTMIPFNYWFSATKNDIVRKFPNGRPDYEWAPDDYDRFNTIGREQFNFESLKTRKPSKDFLSLNGLEKSNRSLFYDNFKDMNCYISYLEKGISLDGFGVNYTSAPSIDRLNKFHYDSYFSVVSEGGNDNRDIYDDKLQGIETDSLFITEKTWRPIHTGHPFIISGDIGTLELLRSWGFETFPEVFDESYDEHHTDYRDKFIVSEVKRVSNLSSKAKHDLFKSVEEKVKHNQNHFFENDIPIEECINKLKKNERKEIS
jgi:hypothetical protein